MPDNTTKDKPPHYGLHPPYAAVCLFRRQAGRPDNGNHLESWELRGNILHGGLRFPYIMQKRQRLLIINGN